MRISTKYTPLGINYTIDKKIADTAYSAIYRGHDGKGRNIIIKVIDITDPRPIDLARFNQEYEIIMKLNLKGVVTVYDIVEYENKPALIIEDFGDKSLHDVIKFNKIDIKLFLKIAIQLASILGEIHLKNVIHKNLKPDNIFISGETIKISDFAINSILTKKNEHLYHKEIIEKTLPYISPEQTERINRAIDYRTDLYSLGIIFYEMLTGRLPFASDDPLEIIHFHIARMPKPPVKEKNTIPKVISDIVMKLLRKIAEERYQSSFGLLSDLQKCMKLYDQHGTIDYFPIAADDITSKFSIPNVLIGRGKEINSLLDSFKKICGTEKKNDAAEISDATNMELILVHGAPGIGKSALIHEIQRPIVEKRGYFISGKHEERNRDLPYGSFIEAFQKFVSHILTESEERINFWKDIIKDSVGNNGKIISDVIPDIEHVIGVQADVPELKADAAQNRFNNVFKNFIKSLATAEHPLVLFLDDLQWADRATLRLITTILQDKETQHLMLILSYRDNELDKAHYLKEMLVELIKLEIKTKNIRIGKLNVQDTTNYISNFVHRSQDEIYELGEVVHKKTEGNPFFINQFMKSLYDRNLISYISGKGWGWDINHIMQLQITDNVVDLMSEKIKRLPDKAREILKACSCFGSTFDLELLLEIIDVPPEIIIYETTYLLNEGLIVYIGNKYKFAHDRILEAAYSLIPEDKKAETHYKIGTSILNRSSQKDIEENIDYIVNHLNAGRSHILNKEKRKYLIELNCMAADKAKSSVAFQTAYNYLITAIEMLGPDSWESNYILTLRVYTEAAEAAFLNADFKAMEKYVNEVTSHGISILDTIPVFELKIESLYARNSLYEAVTEGLSVLNKLGFPLPHKPKKYHLILELIKTKRALKGVDIVELYGMKDVDDPKILAIMRAFNTIGVSAYKTLPNLVPLLALRAIRISLKYGNAPETAYSFAAYGMILCGALGEIDDGYSFGKLAFALKERDNAHKLKVRTWHLFESMIRHWKIDIHETLPPLLDAYKLGLETGYIENATSSLHLYCVYSYYSGKPLDELLQTMNEYNDVFTRFSQETNHNYFKITYQAILKLLDTTKDPTEFNGEIYNETVMMPIHTKANDKTALSILYINKLINSYLFGKNEEAVEYGDIAKFHQDSLIGTFFIPVLYFYDSLSRLALAYNSSRSKRRKLLKKVDANLRKFKNWAFHAPVNHEHKYSLIEAERHRLLGNNDDAMIYYQKAVECAKVNGFLQEEAMSLELASYFDYEQGRESEGETKIRKARDLYARWGATAKVRHIERKHPGIFNVKIEDSSSDEGHLQYRRGREALDLSAVINALQAISSEIILENLIKKVMIITIENAGAQRGVLILKEDSKLYIEAEGYGASKEIMIQPSINIDDYEEIPHSVINFVRRTNEPVVLNDAFNEGLFTEDPYIKEKNIRSILCMPLILQQEIKGIIYLENSISTNIFHVERLNMIRLLSSQAAISLQNAILFDRTIKAEKEIQKQYEDMYAQYEQMEMLNEVLEKTSYELMESNEKLEIFKKFAEASGHGLCMSDLTGNIAYNNSAFNQYTDEIVDRIKPLNILDFYPENVRGELEHQIIPKVLKEGQWSGELFLCIPSGALIPTIHNIFIIQDNRGNPLYLAFVITDISDIKKAEKILKESEEKFRLLIETMNDGVCIINDSGMITYVNNSFCEMLGYSNIELLGKTISEFLDDENKVLHKRQLEIRKTGINKSYELEWIKKDMKTLSTIISPRSMHDLDGTYIGSFGIITDITERKVLQEQLLQSQKMEAIGKLAGGVAHDFNNLLTVIIGYCDILQKLTSPDEYQFDIINDIMQAANRSASLTRQLLAFSRKQNLKPVSFSLNNVVTNMRKMLLHIIGENIVLHTLLDSDMKKIKADQGQIEQVIMNLVVNARDAMPGGGELTIKTENAVFDNSPVGTVSGIGQTEYACLIIEDNGIGMDEGVQKKIFEPFFSTKEPGVGTGLGLSVVYGIVNQHKGWIDVSSKTGIGTCFKIYLPVHSSEYTEPSDKSRDELYLRNYRGNGERILLVEDQDEVRKFMIAAITNNNYIVFPSASSEEALQLFDRENGEFDLVISDVVLPDMNGLELVEKLLLKKPDLVIILSSGYSNIQSEWEHIHEKGYHFLQKPYTVEKLLQTIFDAINITVL